MCCFNAGWQYIYRGHNLFEAMSIYQRGNLSGGLVSSPSTSPSSLIPSPSPMCSSPSHSLKSGLESKSGLEYYNTANNIASILRITKTYYVKYSHCDGDQIMPKRSYRFFLRYFRAIELRFRVCNNVIA